MSDGKCRREIVEQTGPPLASEAIDHSQLCSLPVRKRFLKQAPAVIGNADPANPLVRFDVYAYLGGVLLFAVLAPLKSRWRMLVSSLGGCGLGAYLVVDLDLVADKPFIIGLGLVGSTVALATIR